MFKVKKSLVFLVLTSFIFALVSGGKMPYLIFYMIVTTASMSFAATWHALKNINGYQKCEKKDYYVGDKVEVISYVYNDTFTPIPCIQINDKSSLELIGEISSLSLLYLNGNDREIIKNAFELKYRGMYSLGPLYINISDAFGFFTWGIVIYSDIYIKIFPKVHDLEKFNLQSLQAFGNITTKRKAYEDNTSISDIKKYYPGDSVKKIHWKVSAKKNSLHIKNYDMSGSAATYIFLDLNLDSYSGVNNRDLEEKAVECAASLIFYMLKKSIGVNMYINSNEVYYLNGRDIGQFRNFMDTLCEVKASGNIFIKDLISKRISLISKGTTIVIITGDISYEDTVFYCSIKKMKYEIIIIYVSDEYLDVQNKMCMQSCGIRLCFINSHSDIKGVLEQI